MKIKRTPIKKKDKKRSMMLRWGLMRNAENKRRKRKALYTRYKNKWFLELVREATKIEYWTDWNTNRLKTLRVLIENDYNVPLNFFSAFIYYATYKYMHWNKRARDYSNYVGFIQNENTLVNFANFLSSRKMLWRKRNSRWPDDWEDRWGIKTSVKSQKLGKKDKLVKHDIHSSHTGKEINRYL